MLRWFSRKKVATAEAGLAVPAGLDDWVDTVPFERHDTALGGHVTHMPAAQPWALTEGDAAPADPVAAEQRRLAALDARGDDAYRYVAEAAARICQTPIAAITLSDGGRWWLEACVGVSTERAVALASGWRGPALPGASITVMSDSEGRLKSVAQQGIRSYAAVALDTAQDVPVGTLWVADALPREFSPVQLRTLQLLARQTALLLDARARSIA